jgi:hypothetical protein
LKVLVVTVDACTGSLNVAVTKVVTTTPLAPLGGAMVEIVGGELSPGGCEIELPIMSISDMLIQSF